MDNFIYKIKNFSVEFENLTLFKNCEIEILKDKLNIIVGANGVGKTTLLKTISGLIKNKNYKIENGAKEIFYLPQNIKYPTNITLYDYLSSIYFKTTLKWFLTKSEKQNILNILKELEILSKKDLTLDKLSSGELQKANIALGLASGADFLLLDEPTSNMDLINQIKTMNVIKKLTTKHMTALVVMHDLNLASNYGDYFIGLGGKEIIKGCKSEFFTSENLRIIYGIDFKVINNEKDFYVQIFS